MATYMHYLDRELRASVSADIGGEVMHDVTSIVAVTTTRFMYCSVSFVYETCLQDERLMQLVARLLQYRRVHIVSGYPTLAEFLDSRTILYAHDANRYPMYFRPARALPSSVTPIHKPSSATQSLVRSIRLRCSIQGTPIRAVPRLATSVIDTLLEGIDALGSKAVTYAAFQEHLAVDRPLVSAAVRRTISEEYTQHYLDVYDGDIVSGIPGLYYYDRLARNFPFLDYPVLQAVALLTFPLGLLYDERGCLSDPLVTQLGTPDHQLYADMVVELIDTLMAFYSIPRNAGVSAEGRHRLIMHLARVPRTQRKARRATSKPYIVGLESLQRYVEGQCRKDGQFREAQSMAQLARARKPVRVLLATATDLEDDVLFHNMKGRGRPGLPIAGQKGAYFRIGVLGTCELLWVRSRMGSIGPNASELTMADAIDDLAPHYVISYGIAFGKSAEKQSIGDVLVSEWVRLYEKQRVGESKAVARGERLPASGVLLQLSSIVRGRFSDSRVHTGGIMSGEKLVDRSDLKAAIFEFEPEAIGGDMEGGGIVSACERRRVDWLVVKGICDWGENKNDSARNKDQDQHLAADHALRFVWRLVTECELPVPLLRQS